jgi:xyloglucan-specific exo-beta-1,4-glucanase
MKASLIFKLIKALCLLPLISYYTMGQQLFNSYGEYRSAFLQDYPENQVIMDEYEGSQLNQFFQTDAFWNKRIGASSSFQLPLDAYESLSSNQTSSDASSNWQLLGPTNPASNYEGIGRLAFICFDPTDQTDNTFFVGSPWGGLWKTTDGGSSWQNSGTDFSNMFLIQNTSCMAIDPTDHNYMYLGTGNRDDYHFATIGVGIMRSSDGGTTWTRISMGFFPDGTNFSFDQIGSLLIDPNNTNIVYAATSKGIYKTTNAKGAFPVWNKILPIGENTFERFYKILFKPGTTELYASGIGVYKSTAGGQNWTNILQSPYTGLDYSDFQTSNLSTPFPVLINIDFSPISPNRLFARVTCSNTENSPTNPLTWQSSSLTGFYYLENTTWSFIDGALNSGGGWDDNGPSRTAIIADANDANRFITGQLYLKYGDITSSQTGDFNSNNKFSSLHMPHADFHDLAFSPHNKVLFLINDGGVFKDSDNDYTNNTTASSWINLNRGLSISLVNRLGASSSNPNIVLMGQIDNGSWAYEADQQIPWRRIGGSDGGEQVVDKDNENNWISTLQYYNGKSISFDKFLHSNTIQSPPGIAFCNGNNSSDNPPPLIPIVQSPDESNTYYFGFRELHRYKLERINGVYSQNRTKISNFTEDFNNYGCGYYTTQAIGLSVSNPSVIYVASLVGPPPNSRLFKTVTRGYSNLCSTNCWIELEHPHPEYAITSIAVDDVNPNNVYIIYSHYDDNNQRAYLSNDGGNNWVNISEGLPRFPLIALFMKRVQKTYMQLQI